MLTEVCAELRNYFVTEIHEGIFEIVGGKLAPLDFLQEGQYFRIVGSVFNDGVHKSSTSALVDEKFSGAVWAMAVPSAVVALAEEIRAYNEGDEGRLSPYTSESFGGYSYSKATDENGLPVSWQRLFRWKLDKYRRISVL